MIAERGVIVSHTTIMRWVIRYVPELEKRWNRFARPIGSSWRVDEPYISIKGQWHYLYRAVDKQGRSIDSLLRPDQGVAAAQAFFRRALVASGSTVAQGHTRWSRTEPPGVDPSAKLTSTTTRREARLYGIRIRVVYSSQTRRQDVLRELRPDRTQKSYQRARDTLTPAGDISDATSPECRQRM